MNQNAITADSRIYAYQPLAGPNHFRLIILEPALLNGEPLQISFLSGKLTDFEAQYEAISYTWGDLLLDYPLHIGDDTYVKVTANLDRALRHFRLPVTKRWLWADAVCINQADDVEKATQIPLMTQLFCNATRVLAWVGGGLEAERGMLYLSTLSRSSRDRSKLQTHIRARDPSIQTSQGVAVRQFLSLSWFSRLWIVQEVVFNHDVNLICQQSELSWSRLVSSLNIIQKAVPGIALLIGSAKLEAILNIARLWRYHCTIDEPKNIPSEGRSENLVALVGNFWSYGCSDTRDRIYALYSMSSDIDPSINSLTEESEPNTYMKIDYALNVQQTYYTFAKACIAKGYVVEILNAVLSRQLSARTEDWPSWVPDWRKPPSTAHRFPKLEIQSRDSSCAVSDSTLGWPGSEGTLRLTLFTNSKPLDLKAPTVSRIIRIKKSQETLLSALHELSLNFPRTILIMMLWSALGHQDNTIKEGGTWVNCKELLLHAERNTAQSLPLGFSGLIEALLRILHDQCFFVARAPLQQWYSGQYAPTFYVGYGNLSMHRGDVVQDVRCANWHRFRGLESSGEPALLLRPVKNPHDTTDNKVQRHRLIGSAYLSPPCTREGVLNQQRDGTSEDRYITIYLE